MEGGEADKGVVRLQEKKTAETRRTRRDIQVNEKAFFNSYPAEIGELYAELCGMLRSIGPYKAEVKKTSIHLVNTKAFAGIHPKKSYLGVNLVLSRPKAGPPAHKVEQVSKNRFHHFFQITSASQMGKEFKALLKEAYHPMKS